MAEKPTPWKLLIFLIAVVSLIYGAALIADVRLNEQKYTKLENFEKLIVEEFSSPIQHVDGIIKSKNGFFTNELVEAKFELTTSDEIKNINIIFKEVKSQSNVSIKNDKDEAIKTELTKDLNSKWKLNKKDIVFYKEGEYNIIFSGVTIDNQMFNVITDDSISIYNTLDQLQFEANKQTIKNGIIMEGISWIIIGATGITFLAQIGIKNDD